ncbi:MAG: hypothetical protein FJ096_07050 [Deltaproteobacteria bacterium]|nr:hypothetical protein [Deltaproteobacteria bacterium]
MRFTALTRPFASLAVAHCLAACAQVHPPVPPPLPQGIPVAPLPEAPKPDEPAPFVPPPAVAELHRPLVDPDAPPPVPPPPQHRVVMENLTGVRVNPLGLENRYLLAWRERLYRHDSAALRDNHIGVAVSNIQSPAFYRHGVVVEARPLTLLTLSAGVHRIGYYGSFQFLQGYPDAHVDFSDSAMRRGAEEGKNRPARGVEVELRGQLLGKVGPMVLRSDTSFYYTDVELRPGELTYYTPRYDLLMPNRGFAMTSDNDVLYFSEFGLVAGVRTSVGNAFYDAAMLRGLEDMNGPTVRVGPLVAYTFYDRPGTVFNKPTVFFNAGFWLAHRFRTGEDVSQAMPMIAAGFRFEGDLLRRD